MKDIETHQITAIIDNREKNPWDLAPMKMESGTLTTGDITLKNLEHHIAIEKKSGLSELCQNIGASRARFQRELDRLRAFPVSAVIVEASWADVMAGNYPRSKLTVNHVAGSITAWIAQGQNFILAGDRETAQRIARSILFHAAKYRIRESASFIEQMATVTTTK